MWEMYQLRWKNKQTKKMARYLLQILLAASKKKQQLGNGEVKTLQQSLNGQK